MLSISVVLPLYNGSRFIRPQIESVLGQLVSGDELIVVDDSSTDPSCEIVASYGSPYVHLVRNETNQGVRFTVQRGLEHAQNDIIFLCDQDDIWLPGKRAAFIAEFERDSGVSLVISDAEVIDEEGRLIARSFMNEYRGGFRGGVLQTIWRNSYLGCALAVRKSVLDRALPIPQGAPMHDMWLGVIAKLSGRVTYLSTPYLQYRRHASNYSPDRPQSWGRRLRWRWSLACAIANRMVTRKVSANPRPGP
jgi:glycosyltransferase involved in cell wall biosynthesis